MMGPVIMLAMGVWAGAATAFEIQQNNPDNNPGQAFWAVYERQDIEAAERTLEELREDYPAWTPSLELLNALERLRARERIITASQNGNADRAITLYEQRPQLQARGCDDVALRWAIARAYAQLNQNRQSQTLLTDTLRECTEPDIREGTVSAYAKSHSPKAAQQAIEQLRQAGEISAARARELISLSTQAQSSTPALTATFADANARQSQAKEDEFARNIIDRRSQVAANVLGWYWYRLERFDRAIEWFQRSRDWGVNAKSIEGLARSHMAKDQPQRAEAIARPWRDRWDSVATAYRLTAIQWLDGEADLPSSAIRAITQFARSTNSPELWRSLGWHYLDQQSGPPAIRAFEQALAADHSPETLEGLVLAHQQTGNRQQARELIANNIERSPAYRDQLTPLRGGSQITDWFENAQYARVISAIDAEQSDRDLQLMLAWSHFHLGNLARAHQLFKRMHQQSPSPETAEGLRQTRQLGR